MDVERVVREVLAELGIAPAVGEGEKANPKRPGTAVPGELDKHDPSELAVDARVVTMDAVLGRLATVRRLVVSRQAVVTPAVRDELLRRGIALGYAESANGHAPAETRLVMIVSGADFDPAGLVAVLGREGVKVECSASDCVIAATDQLAAEVARPDTLGMLLTQHVAAGLCLANRLRGVRAVTGVEAPTVTAATAAVGANLLVVDPLAGSFFPLKQMVTEFCRGGARPCPNIFRARLA